MDTATIDVPRLSVGTAGLIAGVGLLLMAVVSFLSLPVLEGVAVPGEPTTTAANITESGALFDLAIVGVFFVIVLDVVVAWALYVFLRPVHRSLSMLAMVFRLVYAAVFAAALSNLFVVSDLLGGSTTSGAFTPTQVDGLVLVTYNAFAFGWDVVLAISGFHLLVVGYLVVKSAYVPKYVGALLALAGLGYVFDTVARLLIEGYALEVTLVTFVGEVVFLAWLLYRGRTIERRDLTAAGQRLGPDGNQNV